MCEVLHPSESNSLTGRFVFLKQVWGMHYKKVIQVSLKLRNYLGCRMWNVCSQISWSLLTYTVITVKTNECPAHIYFTVVEGMVAEYTYIGTQLLLCL